MAIFVIVYKKRRLTLYVITFVREGRMMNRINQLSSGKLQVVVNFPGLSWTFVEESCR